MPFKTISLSYFSLNTTNILLATLFLIMYFFLLTYLTLWLIQLKHTNYCTPLMLYMFGKKACNKAIYKTAIDEIQNKIEPKYKKIDNSIKKLNDEYVKTDLVKQMILKNEIDNTIKYQETFYRTASAIDNLENTVKDINFGYVNYYRDLIDLQKKYKDFLQDISERLKNYLNNLQYQINIAYVTPSIFQLVDPMVKIYKTISSALVKTGYEFIPLELTVPE
jgi:hypothetical protein